MCTFIFYLFDFIGLFNSRSSPLHSYAVFSQKYLIKDEGKLHALSFCLSLV